MIYDCPHPMRMVLSGGMILVGYHSRDATPNVAEKEHYWCKNCGAVRPYGADVWRLPLFRVQAGSEEFAAELAERERTK